MLYLKHHGVKGQQWGVRNGPPYPIEDKVLKKGTRLNSVSGTYLDSNAYRNSGRWMYTYNPNDKWDSKVYKGPFAYYLAKWRGAYFLAEHSFETVKDLKMPNKSERIKEFQKLYENPKSRKAVVKDLQGMQKKLVQAGHPAADEYAKLNLKELKTPKDYQTAYKIFNHAMERADFFKSTKMYSKNMAEKYDAMVDDNNQGVYNNAHDPIIIFKANEALKAVGEKSVQSVKGEEVYKNMAAVQKELAKEGKSMMF